MRKIDPDKSLFTIGTVAEILGVNPRMLRLYEERGIIEPTRSSSNRRLYSLKDIDILSYVHYLTCVKKVNLAGVLEIQRILQRMKESTRLAFLEEIQQEIEALPNGKKELYQKGETAIINEITHESAGPARPESPTETGT